MAVVNERARRIGAAWRSLGSAVWALPWLRAWLPRGYCVRGYDPGPEALDAATCPGVEAAASAGDAVSEAVTVITMLPSAYLDDPPSDPTRPVGSSEVSADRPGSG
jgi:hypothetical protein